MAIPKPKSAGTITPRRTPPTPTPTISRLGRGGGSPGLDTSRAEIERVKESLKQLSASELKEVRDYASLLAQNSASDSRSGLKPSQILSREENIWLSRLHFHLSRATGISSSPPIVAPGRDRSLGASFEFVEAFLKQAGIWQKETYSRVAVYDLLADLLVRHARQLAHKVQAPLGMKFVLQNTNKLPELFDLAYPGYLPAGLARMVISKHLQSPKE